MQFLLLECYQCTIEPCGCQAGHGLTSHDEVDAGHLRFSPFRGVWFAWSDQNYAWGK